MNPENLAVIFGAIALGSLAKGLTGIGLPLISIPIIASFLGVEHAVVIMTLPVFLSNVWIVRSYRRQASAIPGLGLALGAAVAGTVAGTYVLATLGDRTLSWVLVVWIAIYLANLAVNPDFRLEGKAARRASPVLACAAGIAQGSMGISGPVIATWIHSYRMRAEAYVFGVSVMFLAISATHVLAVAGAGLMDRTRFIQGLVAVIPMAVFLPIGMRMTRHIGPKLFNRLIIAFIVAMEIKLIWQAIVAG